MMTFRLVLDPGDVLAWIPPQVWDDGELCGLDMHGWEDDTWILHDLTVPADPDAPESGPRVRRRWRDIASGDIAALASARAWPPNALALLEPRWPQIEVEEGVLGGESLAALVQILTGVLGPQAKCFAFYGKVAANDYDRVTPFETPLSGIVDLPRSGLFHDLSPSNWWPEDRSWFVWTDYDLTATRVSGSRHLIEQVRDHPALETLDWIRPDDPEPAPRNRS